MTEKIEVEYSQALDKETELEVVCEKLRNRTFRILQITVFYDLPIPPDADFEAALSRDWKAKGASNARMTFGYDLEKRVIWGDYNPKKIGPNALIRREVKDDEIHNVIMSNSEPHKSVEGLWSAPIRVVYVATADDEGYAKPYLQKIAIAVPEDDDH